MDGERQNPAVALRHPIFLGALSLLLVNDHWLKGAGVLPGGLTGKLSDFAGLIVAPVLAAALFRTRHRGTRALVFGLVVAPFVAINVSADAAVLMEMLTASLGFPWRIWTDPSDLVGLAALPIAWWLLDARPFALPASRAVERTALILSAFACMATSDPDPEMGFIEVEIPPPDYSTVAWIHNDIGTDLDVRLSWLTAQVLCERISEAPGHYLSRTAFDDGLTVTLDPDRNFPLSRDAAGDALDLLGGALGTSPNASCDAVLVQYDGAPPTVIYFQAGSRETVPRHGGTGSPRAAGVGSAEGAYGGDGQVVVVDAQRPHLEGGLCEGTLGLSFAYSGERINRGTVATVRHTELLRDGCFAVDFEAAPRAWRSHLCVPMWAFDLAIDDQVEILSANPDSLVLARIGTPERPATELRVERFDALWSTVGDEYWEVVDAGRCASTPTRCGSYTEPGLIENDAGVQLAGGDEYEGVLDDGRPYRLAVGAVERLLVAGASCSADERVPRMQFDTVTFVEESM